MLNQITFCTVSKSVVLVMNVDVSEFNACPRTLHIIVHVQVIRRLIKIHLLTHL